MCRGQKWYLSYEINLTVITVEPDMSISFKIFSSLIDKLKLVL